MITKVKALIWEECRTGGVITLWCCLMGSLVMSAMRIEMGVGVLQKDILSHLLYIGGIPLASAALLILNPDHKGHLHGGFSTRILQLPVPTFIPVAISLLLRTTFIFIAALVIVTLSQLLFAYAPGYEFVVLLVALYLVMQLFDWMRFSVSGLSSAVAVLCIGIASLFFFNDGDKFFNDLFAAFSRQWRNHSTMIVTALLLSLLLTYAVSLITVLKIRTGRRYGIPEIWEWHNYLNVSKGRVRNPFNSPIRAQVWLDLRKSLFLLPIIASLVTLGIWIIIGINASPKDFSTSNVFLRAYAPFIGLLVGAFVQSAKLGVLGVRRTKGMPGYTFIQPMSHAQFATARMIANALLLFPAAALATVLHFSYSGGAFVTEIIPEAYSLGLTSPREIAWVLLTRAILITLFAWAVLAIETRLIESTILVSIALPVILWITNIKYPEHIFNLSFSLFLVLLCSGAYIRAWRTSLISARTALFWGSIWLLITWIIFGQSAVSLSTVTADPVVYAAMLCTCLAIASLAPLPYISTVYDIRKKRHSAAPKQNPMSFNTPTTRTKFSKPVAAACIGIVAFGIWLGIPSRPAWESLWQSKGYPVTLQDLNDWYPAVPDEENHALKYMNIADLRNQKEGEYEELLISQKKDPRDNYEHLFIVGGADVGNSEPIPPEILKATEEYWQHITSHVAPDLKTLAMDSNAKSRYPIDLTDGFNMRLTDLATLRALSRELSLDTLHWSINNNPAKATDSTLAILAIADSLEYEPLLISGLVRTAILGMSLDALEILMSRAAPTEQDLARIQQTLQTRSDALKETPLLQHAIIGESTVSMNFTSTLMYAGETEYESLIPVASLIPVSLFGLSIPAENMVIGIELNQSITESSIEWRDLHNAENYDDSRDSYFITPLAAITMPSLNRSRESSYRIQTQFDLATTATAVQRYRLENKNLPKTLDDLIPQYLTAIPEDYFAGPGNPIKYRIHENKAFTLYSVGRDTKDDNGEDLKRVPNDDAPRGQRRKSRIEGDITFTIHSQKPTTPNPN